MVSIEEYIDVDAIAAEAGGDVSGVDIGGGPDPGDVRVEIGDGDGDGGGDSDGGGDGIATDVTEDIENLPSGDGGGGGGVDIGSGEDVSTIDEGGPSGGGTGGGTQPPTAQDPGDVQTQPIIDEARNGQLAADLRDMAGGGGRAGDLTSADVEQMRRDILAQRAREAASGGGGRASQISSEDVTVTRAMGGPRPGDVRVEPGGITVPVPGDGPRTVTGQGLETETAGRDAPRYTIDDPRPNRGKFTGTKPEIARLIESISLEDNVLGREDVAVVETDSGLAVRQTFGGLQKQWLVGSLARDIGQQFRSDAATTARISNLGAIRTAVEQQVESQRNLRRVDVTQGQGEVTAKFPLLNLEASVVDERTQFAISEDFEQRDLGDRPIYIPDYVGSIHGFEPGEGATVEDYLGYEAKRYRKGFAEPVGGFFESNVPILGGALGGLATGAVDTFNPGQAALAAKSGREIFGYLIGDPDYVSWQAPPAFGGAPPPLGERLSAVSGQAGPVALGTVRYTQRKPFEFLGGVGAGLLTGAAVSKVGTFGRGFVRTVGGKEIPESDLVNVKALDEGSPFPAAEDPGLYRRNPAAAVESQAQRYTPEVIEQRFASGQPEGVSMADLVQRFRDSGAKPTDLGRPLSTDLGVPGFTERFIRSGRQPTDLGRPLSTDLGVPGFTERFIRSGRQPTDLGRPLPTDLGVPGFAERAAPYVQRVREAGAGPTDLGRPLTTDLGVPGFTERFMAAGRQPTDLGRPLPTDLGVPGVTERAAPYVQRFKEAGAGPTDLGRPLATDLGVPGFSERAINAAPGRPSFDLSRVLSADGPTDLGRPLPTDLGVPGFSERAAVTTRRILDAGAEPTDLGRPLLTDLGVPGFTERFMRAGRQPTDLGRPLLTDLGVPGFAERVAPYGRRFLEAGRQPTDLGRPLATDLGVPGFTERVAPYGRRFLEAGGGRTDLGRPLLTDLGEDPLASQLYNYRFNLGFGRGEGAGVTDGVVLKKALDVEPESPGRGVGGFTSPDPSGQIYESPGSFFGPELSRYFLRAERRGYSLRPGLPSFGGKPTAVLAKTDVENTRATTLQGFNKELIERSGETTALAKPGGAVATEEIEAVVPPSARFSAVSDTGPLNRLGIGSDFYTRIGGRRVPGTDIEFGGRRVPLRLVAPDSDAGAGAGAAGAGRPLSYYSEGFESVTDRPLPLLNVDVDLSTAPSGAGGRTPSGGSAGGVSEPLDVSGGLSPLPSASAGVSAVDVPLGVTSEVSVASEPSDLGPVSSPSSGVASDSGGVTSGVSGTSGRPSSPASPAESPSGTSPRGTPSTPSLWRLPPSSGISIGPPTSPGGSSSVPPSRRDEPTPYTPPFVPTGWLPVGPGIDGESETQENEPITDEEYEPSWYNKFVVALAGGDLAARQAPANIERIAEERGTFLGLPTAGQVAPDEALGAGLSDVEELFFVAGGDRDGATDEGDDLLALLGIGGEGKGDTGSDEGGDDFSALLDFGGGESEADDLSLPRLL